MPRGMRRAMIGVVALGISACTSDTEPGATAEPELGLWWEAEGETMTPFQDGPGEWASSRKFYFPPDEAYPRYALPAGQEAYADLDPHRITGYIH